MKKADPRKIIQALNYFASKQQDKTLNKMKAYKLLWLADRYHLRQFGRPITDDSYYAVKFGPIPTDAKHILDAVEPNLQVEPDEIHAFIGILNKYEFVSKKEPNLKVFSETDLDVLNLILEKFNGKDHFELSEISHQFPEWKRHEQNINNSKKANRYKIKSDDFFLNVDDESKLFKDDSELLDLTSEIYRTGCI